MTFLNIMFSLLDFKCILILISLLLITIWLIRQPRNLPPGPFGWPVLGYIPQMIFALYKGEQIHEVLQRLTQKYGKMTSINIFGVPVIVLNDATLIREAFQNPNMCNKGFNNALQVRLCGHALMQNATFNQYRKFASSTLRRFGVGTNKFEEHVTEQLQVLVEEIKERHNGQPVNPEELLYFTNASIVCPVLFGKKFDFDDEEARDLLRTNFAAMQLLGQAGYEILLPFTLPTTTNRALWAASKKLMDFINGTIEDHRNNLDPDNFSDYTDVYLNEVAQKLADSPNSYLHKENVAGQLFFLFMAVANPVTSWIHWAIIYLATHPDVQERAHKELDSVIGRDRLPKLSDQKSLPYLKAVTYELHRIITLVTLGHMHSVSTDVHFHGYTFPEGSVIISNLWGIHHDPDLWSNPDEFEPERFLNENGEFVLRDGYIPYGTGRRICLGENLARTENYLFLTHLLHHFNFTKDQDHQTFDFKGTAGLIRSPPPQTPQIKFVERE